MQVKVLGSGCAKCKLLFAEAEQAIALSGQPASLAKVEAPEELAAYGIMATPALVIDEHVVSAGRVPRADEIARLLARAAEVGRS